MQGLNFKLEVQPLSHVNKRSGDAVSHELLKVSV